MISQAAGLSSVWCTNRERSRTRNIIGASDRRRSRPSYAKIAIRNSTLGQDGAQLREGVHRGSAPRKVIEIWPRGR